MDMELVVEDIQIMMPIYVEPSPWRAIIHTEPYV